MANLFDILKFKQKNIEDDPPKGSGKEHHVGASHKKDLTGVAERLQSSLHKSREDVEQESETRTVSLKDERVGEKQNDNSGDKDEKIVDLDILKQFTIPKKKKVNKDLFEAISLNGREFQQEILGIVRQSLRDRNDERNFKFTYAAFVHNAKLLRDFLDRRKSMRAEGYSEKEVGDTYAFLCVDSDHEVKKICEEGIKTGNVKTSVLGNPEMGVSLCKHADVVRSGGWVSNHQNRLVIFKVIKGKVKSMAENRSGSLLDPTPNFDCHVSKTANVDLSTTLPQQAWESTQLYIYEYGDLEIEARPRQACPYAVVHFTYTGDAKQYKAPLVRQTSKPRQPLLQRQVSPKGIPSSPVQRTSPLLPTTPVSSSGTMPPPGGAVTSSTTVTATPSPPVSHIGERVDGDGYVVWAGKLLGKGRAICEVEMVRFGAAIKPARLGEEINLVTRLAMASVRTNKYLGNITSLKKDDELAVDGKFFNYCQLRPVKEGQGKFNQVMTFLGKKEVAATVKLEDNVEVLILTNCDVTQHLGLSLANHHPMVLHCIFISTASRKCALLSTAACLQKLNLEPASQRPQQQQQQQQQSSSGSLRQGTQTPLSGPASPRQNYPGQPLLGRGSSAPAYTPPLGDSVSSQIAGVKLDSITQLFGMNRELGPVGDIDMRAQQFGDVDLRQGRQLGSVPDPFGTQHCLGDNFSSTFSSGVFDSSDMTLAGQDKDFRQPLNMLQEPIFKDPPQPTRVIQESDPGKSVDKTYDDGFQRFVPVESLIYKEKLIPAFKNQESLQDQFNIQVARGETSAEALLAFAQNAVTQALGKTRHQSGAQASHGSPQVTQKLSHFGPLLYGSDTRKGYMSSPGTSGVQQSPSGLGIVSMSPKQPTDPRLVKRHLSHPGISPLSHSGISPPAGSFTAAVNPGSTAVNPGADQYGNLGQTVSPSLSLPTTLPHFSSIATTAAVQSTALGNTVFNAASENPSSTFAIRPQDPRMPPQNLPKSLSVGTSPMKGCSPTLGTVTTISTTIIPTASSMSTTSTRVAKPRTTEGLSTDTSHSDHMRGLVFDRLQASPSSPTQDVYRDKENDDDRESRESLKNHSRSSSVESGASFGCTESQGTTPNSDVEQESKRMKLDPGLASLDSSELPDAVVDMIIKNPITPKKSTQKTDKTKSPVKSQEALASPSKEKVLSKKSGTGKEKIATAGSETSTRKDVIDTAQDMRALLDCSLEEEGDTEDEKVCTDRIDSIDEMREFLNAANDKKLQPEKEPETKTKPVTKKSCRLHLLKPADTKKFKPIKETIEQKKAKIKSWLHQNRDKQNPADTLTVLGLVAPLSSVKRIPKRPQASGCMEQAQHETAKSPNASQVEKSPCSEGTDAAKLSTSTQYLKCVSNVSASDLSSHLGLPCGSDLHEHDVAMNLEDPVAVVTNADADNSLKISKMSQELELPHCAEISKCVKGVASDGESDVDYAEKLLEETYDSQGPRVGLKMLRVKTFTESRDSNETELRQAKIDMEERIAKRLSMTAGSTSGPTGQETSAKLSVSENQKQDSAGSRSPHLTHVDFESKNTSLSPKILKSMSENSQELAKEEKVGDILKDKSDTEIVMDEGQDGRTGVDERDSEFGLDDFDVGLSPMSQDAEEFEEEEMVALDGDKQVEPAVSADVRVEKLHFDQFKMISQTPPSGSGIEKSDNEYDVEKTRRFKTHLSPSKLDRAVEKTVKFLTNVATSYSFGADLKALGLDQLETRLFKGCRIEVGSKVEDVAVTFVWIPRKEPKPPVAGELEDTIDSCVRTVLFRHLKCKEVDEDGEDTERTRLWHYGLHFLVAALDLGEDHNLREVVEGSEDEGDVELLVEEDSTEGNGEGQRSRSPDQVVCVPEGPSVTGQGPLPGMADAQSAKVEEVDISKIPLPADPLPSKCVLGSSSGLEQNKTCRDATVSDETKHPDSIPATQTVRMSSSQKLSLDIKVERTEDDKSVLSKSDEEHLSAKVHVESIKTIPQAQKTARYDSSKSGSESLGSTSVQGQRPSEFFVSDEDPCQKSSFSDIDPVQTCVNSLLPKNVLMQNSAKSSVTAKPFEDADDIFKAVTAKSDSNVSSGSEKIPGLTLVSEVASETADKPVPKQNPEKAKTVSVDKNRHSKFVAKIGGAADLTKVKLRSVEYFPGPLSLVGSKPALPSRTAKTHEINLEKFREAAVEVFRNSQSKKGVQLVEYTRDQADFVRKVCEAVACHKLGSAVKSIIDHSKVSQVHSRHVKIVREEGVVPSNAETSRAKKLGSQVLSGKSEEISLDQKDSDLGRVSGPGDNSKTSDSRFSHDDTIVAESGKNSVPNRDMKARLGPQVTEEGGHVSPALLSEGGRLVQITHKEPLRPSDGRVVEVAGETRSVTVVKSEIPSALDPCMTSVPSNTENKENKSRAPASSINQAETCSKKQNVSSTASRASSDRDSIKSDSPRNSRSSKQSSSSSSSVSSSSKGSSSSSGPSRGHERTKDDRHQRQYHPYKRPTRGGPISDEQLKQEQSKYRGKGPVRELLQCQTETLYKARFARRTGHIKQPPSRSNKPRFRDYHFRRNSQNSSSSSRSGERSRSSSPSSTATGEKIYRPEDVADFEERKQRAEELDKAPVEEALSHMDEDFIIIDQVYESEDKNVDPSMPNGAPDFKPASTTNQRASSAHNSTARALSSSNAHGKQPNRPLDNRSLLPRHALV